MSVNKQVNDFLASLGQPTEINKDMPFPGTGNMGKEYTESDIDNIPRECSGLPYPLNDEQFEVAKQILKWLNRYFKELKQRKFAGAVNCKSWNRLAGLAGTGKTAIISYVFTEGLKYLPPEVRFKKVAVCTYAWKAALVLRERGIDTACSIHSLIYKPYEDEEGKLKFYRRSIDEVIGEFSIIIIDESSMVDFYTRTDLESYGIPVLYVGDHGQLPSISNHKDDIVFMENAEWKLQQINRQAKDSPIIRLAYMARNGEYIKHGTYGNGIIKVHADDEEVSAALLSKMDQVICGTNDTRGILNRNIRRHLGHNVRLLPAKGESLIGTTNVVGQQVFNGQQWVCDSDDLGGVPLKFGSRKKMRITIPGTDEFRFISFAFPEDELFDKFGDNESAAFRMMKDEEIYGIDFGYAITCHKCIVGGTVTPTSQGLLTLDEFHQENGLSTKVGEFESLPTTVTTSNGLTSKDTIDSFFNNGVDDVLKITTTRLYELKATRNHNIPVIRNGSVIMVHAENIIESDRVLLNTATNAFNDEIIVNEFGKLDRNLAILLGLFISCGSINEDEITFHGVSDEDREMVCNYIWRYFGSSKSVFVDEDGRITTFIPKDKIGIWKELTNTDSIHVDIRKSPERVQKMFIKGLTMSSKIIYKVSKLPTRRVFKFRSLSFKFKDNVSHNFMEMLRYMMLNFGVVTSMYKHSPKELRIFGYWARTFFERIGLSQYKHYSFFEKLVRSDKANLDDKPNVAIRIGDLTKQIFEEAIEIDPKFKRLFSKIIDIDKIDMNIHSEILHKVVNVLRNDRNAYAIIRKSINYRFFEKIVLGDLVIDIVTDVEDDGKHPTFCLRMSNSTLPMFTQNGILGGNSQGSSWGKVAVFDESYIFGRGKGNKDNAKKWLYTAITRAENKLLILGN